jgi:hypothetical protein
MRIAKKMLLNEKREKRRQEKRKQTIASRFGEAEKTFFSHQSIEIYQTFSHFIVYIFCCDIGVFAKKNIKTQQRMTS